MQSVSITTKVVILNPAHDEIYSIQLYVIKFVRDFLDLRRSMVFTGYSGFLHQKKKKNDRHDITERFVKMALHTITLLPFVCTLFIV